jgi:hypothetical protein
METRRSIFWNTFAFACSAMAMASMPALAGPPAAVHACGDLDSIGGLMGNVRSFAEGRIRVALISTEEPVAAPEHVLIFVPFEPIGNECFAISATAEGRGFGSADLTRLRASYDAIKGLSLSFPVSSYVLETHSSRPAMRPEGEVKVRVRREGGAYRVTVE